MTVSTTTNKISYSCDGATVVFPYTFPIFADGDLTVTLRSSAGAETTLTLTTDYAVSGAGDASGGNVTTVATYASGNTLVIERTLDITQGTDYITGGAFPAEEHEKALDRLTMIAQQLKEKVSRALKFAVSSSYSGIDVPDPSADKVLGWDSTGAALENKTPSSVVTGGVAVVGNYSNFAAAVAAIGSTPMTLLINQACTVSADLTVPSTLRLWFAREGSVSVDSGFTLTVQGGIDAGFHAIFPGAGTVDLTRALVKEVYPHWWGAAGDGSTDCAAALQSAFDNIASGGVVYLPAGAYSMMNGATLPNAPAITLRGAGYMAPSAGGADPVTLLDFQGDGPEAVLTVAGASGSNNRGGVLENFAIDGNNAASALAGIQYGTASGGTNLSCTRWLTRNVYVTNCAAGFDLWDQALGNRFEGAVGDGNTRNWLFRGRNHNSQILHSASINASTGIDIVPDTGLQASNVVLDGIDSEGNTVGVNIVDASRTTLVNSYFEDNANAGDLCVIAGLNSASYPVSTSVRDNYFAGGSVQNYGVRINYAEGLTLAWNSCQGFMTQFVRNLPSPNGMQSLTGYYYDNRTVANRGLDDYHDFDVVSYAQSGARAYLPSTQYIDPSTGTMVGLTAEEFDNQNEFNIASPTCRFTANNGGDYFVQGQVRYDNPDAGVRVQVYVRKNGATNVIETEITPAAAQQHTITCSGIVNLAAGDYLQLWVWHGSAGIESITGGARFTFMSVYRMK